MTGVVSFDTASSNRIFDVIHALRCRRIFLSNVHPLVRLGRVYAYTERYTTPTRSPAAAARIAILLDRRTTLLSNDRHVYAPRYHHSLSLRRKKKKLCSTFNATPIPYQIVTSLSPPPSSSSRFYDCIFNAGDMNRVGS